MGEATATSFRGTVFIALIAAMAPLTVAVYGGLARSRELALAQLAKEKELALATQEQDFKMRMEFLDRAIDVKRTPEDRQLVLRFLRAVSSDQPLAQWAEAELSSVQDDVETFRVAREQLARALEQQNTLESAARAAGRSSGTGAATEPERRAAVVAVEQASSRVRQLQALRALEFSNAPELLNDAVGASTTPSADTVSKNK